MSDEAKPRKPLRAAVFDLDGLMFNTEQLYEEVGAELLRRRGKQISKDLLDEMMGRPSRISLQIMIDRHQLDATVAVLEAEGDTIFDEILPTRLAPMPGLLDLLGALETADVPKAIATSSRRAFVDNVLRCAGQAGRFQFILTCEDVTRGKPHPEVYLAAARRFGIQPHEMLVLEDSQIGCQAAIASGAFAIAVPAQHSLQHDFSGAALEAQGLDDPRIYQALGLVRPEQAGAD